MQKVTLDPSEMNYTSNRYMVHWPQQHKAKALESRGIEQMTTYEFH